MSLIRVKNVIKDYFLGKTTVQALRGITLDIQKGEYLCVAGPSGSGKSTLLNILGLLDEPSRGELAFDNISVTSLSQRDRHRFRRERISFIFQSFNLVPVLSAYENIEFPLIIQKIEKKERHTRITKLADEVGIRDFLHHKPDELSGGQRQRVAIARALVTKPQVILADEPTANLDSVNGSAVIALMKELNRVENTTFIVASHDRLVMDEAGRMVTIVDGVVTGD